MPDRLTKEQRSRNMSRVRDRDTKPELVIRRLLHSLGFRFRLQRRDLPGRPDLTFPKYKAVVFVHGCFWHGHACPLFRWPTSNEAFWRKKIGRNAARDIDAMTKLIAAGWRVAVVWECALKGSGRLTKSELATTLSEFLRSETVSIELKGWILGDQ